MIEQTAVPSAPAVDAWITEIERSFRELDPGAFFVLPRVLRRVLRHELEITSPWVRIPHRKSYVIGRDRLLWLVALDELGVDATIEVPSRALLLARPEVDRLANFQPASLQLYYWRLLFHARLDAVLQERTAPRSMSPAQLRQRIDRIGQPQFDEIRAVLKQEGYLVAPDDPRNVYAEFVAVYLELREFAPDLLPLYFPSLPPAESLVQLLAEDCDASAILAATRPRNLLAAPSSAVVMDDPLLSLSQTDIKPVGPDPSGVPSTWRYRMLKRAAHRASVQGNAMRTVLLRQKAAQVATPDQRQQAAVDLTEDVRIFAERLQSALELGDEETRRWEAMCLKLLGGAAGGFWNSNARLLYDLQKVCIDHERPVYRVRTLRWLFTLGQSPLRAPLPDLKFVLLVKHLRGAARRVSDVRIDREANRELVELLRHAVHQAESILRDRLGPQIRDALSTVGFQPRDITQRVAFEKVVAELLDTIVERGFLTFGNLRDTISRGQIKLPDLGGAVEFLHGDLLLKADLQLAATLDGVYQKGPFYLRGLQRVMSLFFATHPGRQFTKFLALPFGGAFIIFKGIQEVAHLVHWRGLHTLTEPAGLPFDPRGYITVEHLTILGLGVFLLGVIHWPEFRSGVWLTIRLFWNTLKLLFVDLPRILYRFPPIAWLLRSVPALIFRRYVVSPLALTLVLWKVLPLLGLYHPFNPWWAMVLFVAAYALLNSRMGRDTEELFWEGLGKTWYRIRVTLVVGLFSLIVDLFRSVMDLMDRVLYSVDEWLRFRSGESRVSLVLKALLSPLWQFVNAIIRFCVTLLIEPQINPIKHFPVVTVSHKLLLPFVLYVSKPFEAFFDPISAKAIGTTIVGAIPGIFGFLAWELKENWRLYAANRSPTLDPVVVGYHGETLLHLLTPGFHSGTIPKLFRRRRRIARKSRGQSERTRHAVYDEKLRHEAEAVQHLVEREFVELLAQSHRFSDIPLHVTRVELSTNRIAVDIDRVDRTGSPLTLEFAEQSGRIVAGIGQAGWTKDLTHDQKIVLSTALAGLYHLADVDLVRQHLERQLGSPPHPYDISGATLIVWPTRAYDVEVIYPLEDRPTISPRPRAAARMAHLNPVPASALIFRDHTITWAAWQAFWDQEARGETCPDSLLPGVTLLREG